jgi:hypothetical protein
MAASERQHLVHDIAAVFPPLLTGAGSRLSAFHRLVQLPSRQAILFPSPQRLS